MVLKVSTKEIWKLKNTETGRALYSGLKIKYHYYRYVLNKYIYLSITKEIKNSERNLKKIFVMGI